MFDTGDMSEAFEAKMEAPAECRDPWPLSSPDRRPAAPCGQH